MSKENTILSSQERMIKMLQVNPNAQLVMPRQAPFRVARQHSLYIKYSNVIKRIKYSQCAKELVELEQQKNELEKEILGCNNNE